MKIQSKIIGLLAGVCLLGLALPPAVTAAIDDEEFKALKDLVTKQGQRLDQLENAHAQDQKTIEQNQKIHEQDQQEIQRLKQRLDETQNTATDAQQKAEAASQVQPVHPIPEGRDATHNFMMVGDAEVQFGKVDGSHSAFALADFAPIFLFRARDNILFEAGFDVTLQNGSLALANGAHDSGSGTSVSLSFATLDYLLNDYITFIGGEMLLPLGTYSERGAGWLNKIPDDPLPRSLLPGSGVGAMLRGAVPLGDSGQHLSYALYGANGPSSSDGTGNSTTTDANGNVVPNLDLNGNVGIKSDGTFGNLHGSPSVGGRIGWFFPLKPHYDLELGISGQTGTWDDSDHYRWTAGVLDAAFHVGPDVEVKGEYIYSWQQTADLGTIHPQGWWIQGGYKLAGLGLELPYINNLELVGRYDTTRDGFSMNMDRYTFGYVYYFSNTLLFEGDYELAHSNIPGSAPNLFVFQVSYGF
jgi:regulator of replication initiation timing